MEPHRKNCSCCTMFDVKFHVTEEPSAFKNVSGREQKMKLSEDHGDNGPQRQNFSKCLSFFISGGFGSCRRSFKAFPKCQELHFTLKK